MGGRKKMSGKTINVALTDGSLKMLDFVTNVLGAASRSEAVRCLIRDKYTDLTKPQTGVGIATSLRGITDGNELADEVFAEAKAIWETEK